MAKHYCKIHTLELMDVLDRMIPFDRNAFNNGFSVWKRHSSEFRLFTAFLDAHIKEAGELSFNHEKLRERLLTTGEGTAFIAHTKTDAKSAHLLRSILEKKCGYQCRLSGDAWVQLGEVISALRQNLHLPEGSEPQILDVCTAHLRKLEEEHIANCSHFIFVLPAKLTDDTPSLTGRPLQTSPWLPTELGQAKGLATKSPACTEAEPDLTFMKACKIPALVESIRGKEPETGRKNARGRSGARSLR